MPHQTKDESFTDTMQSAAENSVSEFDRLFAYLMAERLRDGQPYSMQLVATVYEETEQRKNARQSPYDVRYVQRIHDALAPQVAFLRRLRGSDGYSAVFRLIFQR